MHGGETATPGALGSENFVLIMSVSSCMSMLIIRYNGGESEINLYRLRCKTVGGMRGHHCVCLAL